MDNTNENHQLLEAFLRGQLKGEALERFNTLMQQNPELAEEIALFKEVTEVLDEDSWSFLDFDPNNESLRSYLEFYTKNENQAYYQKLKTLNYKEKDNKFNLRYIWGAIGIAAAIFIGIFVWNNDQTVTDYNQLADAYIQTSDLPSFIVRGKIDTLLTLVEVNFNDQNYAAVNNLIDANKDDFSKKELDLIYIYRGIAYIKTGQYEDADKTLSDNEVYQNSLYKPLAEWYLALTMLKKENIEEAKTLLVKFSKDKGHPKHAEAKELLRKLK